MIGFLRTRPIQRRGEALLPFVLAAVIVALGVVVYFELVGLLLEITGW